WAAVVAAATGHDYTDTPGAGAAGGTPFGLIDGLGAQARAGLDPVPELVDFQSHLRGVELAITGERCAGEQALHGQAPAGGASVARRYGIAVAAVAGRNLLSTNVLRASGIQAAYALTDIEPDPAVCMTNAAALLSQLGRRIAGDLDALRRTDARQGVPQ